MDATDATGRRRQLAMPAVPLREAAVALETSVSTLRRWIAQGAPVARRGRRGRRHRTLVEVEAINAWRRAGAAQTAGDRDAVKDALWRLGCEVPQLIADAVWDAWERMEGLPRAHLAGPMAATWYVVTSALLDRLGELGDTLFDIEPGAIPESIQQLRKIAQL